MIIGILQKATAAKENTDNAQIRERIQLAYHSALAGGQGSYTKNTLMDELKNEFETDYDVDDSDDTNWILKAQGQSVTIPAGEKEEIKTAVLQGRDFYMGGNLYKVNPNYYANITAIIHSDSKPTDEIINNPNYLWSKTDSEYPVYFYVDENTMTMYWWSEANHILFDSSCEQMFATWRKLSNISGLKDIDASAITNMNAMFADCSLDDLSVIEDWNVSNVTKMNYAFSGNDKLTIIDLHKWDTSNVTEMYNMFYECSNLSTIYVSDMFVVSQVTNSSDMFRGCTSLVGGSGTTYNSSKIDKTYAHIDGGISNPGYFTAK